MASQSAHFNMTKPASTDNYSLTVVNDNTDIIDTQMYNNQVSAAKVMVGATSSADGESGRVPAPTSADRAKYLKGDGTWDTPSGGGGSSTLAGLTDVNISSPTDGQILKYNSTTQKWENANESGGGGGGSSSHTYSTTEQIVGTWIDGSDVWEKTINIEETTTHVNTPFTIDIETNVGVLIEHSLMYRDSSFMNGRWNPLDGYTNQINNDMYFNRLYLESNGTLKGYFAGSQGVVTICGVIRYTKVSAS